MFGQIPDAPATAPGIFRYSNAEELKKVMEDAGLQKVRIHKVHGTNTFESPQHYWDFMSEIAAPIVGALAGADDATREDISASVLELAGDFERDGKVVFPWKSWVVAGQKAQSNKWV